MLRPARLLTIAALAGITASLAACGTSAAPVGGRNGGPTLPPTPASVPSNYTSIAAMEKALDQVAFCTNQGGQVASCRLNIASDETFRLQIFTTAGGRAQYLAGVRADDAKTQAAGHASRGGLIGPSWALAPDVATPGLIPILKPYLGGQPLS